MSITACFIAPHKSGPLPFLIAFGIWALAMTIGVLDAPKEPTQLGAELAEVNSEWAVQDGELAITIRQFGSDVRGSFADWTADISFEEIAENGRHGTADVTISIGSLSLGTVTQQAMGPDFFNATEFPTARFTGDLVFDDEAHVAQGILTLKGVEVPVTFPFDLAIEGDTATVNASFPLDRMSFGIGQSMPDESSLGFGVTVEIAFTATR